MTIGFIFHNLFKHGEFNIGFSAGLNDIVGQKCDENGNDIGDDKLYLVGETFTIVIGLFFLSIEIDIHSKYQDNPTIYNNDTE